MKKYFVYVLLLKNNKYYYGFTSDIERRIAQHRNGKVKSTKSRFLQLVYYECFDIKSEALRREKYFKSGVGRTFIKQKLELPQVR